MKKSIPVICIFILLFICLPVAHAQQRQPSDTAINNAISWAQSHVGEDSFPLADGSGSSTSYDCCATFVANSYGSAAFTVHTAYLLWFTSDQHSGDWNAPRGSLVFFDRTPDTRGLGHVALSTGDGNIIEAGYPIIVTSTIISESKQAPYLGWAWPPSDWPGRSGGLIEVAIINPVAIVFTVILILCFLIVFLNHNKVLPLRIFGKRSQIENRKS